MAIKEIADKAREELERPRGFQTSVPADLPVGTRQLKTEEFWESEFVTQLVRSLTKHAFATAEEAREHFDAIAESILLRKEHEPNDTLAMERVFERYAALIS
ncbi:hypothetical protein ASY01nite_14250 [Acetobacter syzygii]|uniref:hypothetical protein n=1 Tax=Acetobacter syzygii TaxID=146476 RepID=UPI0005DEE659|nr:hypothetical protein [Acetobacter syzygii]GAN72138.1 hypothetical protein Absy_030_046 [Acetobacter syzygii]GBR64972.1 hypothetical protein AA0483_1627 [Acetobacter syzygii NRIC 0483]GEL56359.1 hypothetical protein ASY01nite_14250 [Acetobacter syzygii]